MTVPFCRAIIYQLNYIFMDSELKQCFDKIDQRFDKIDQHLEKADQRFDELFSFLADNMVTKQEFGEFKSEMYNFRDEANGRLDAISRELDEIKKRLDALERRTIEDADAAANDILELRHRVEYLEEQFKRLQAVH